MAATTAGRTYEETRADIEATLGTVASAVREAGDHLANVRVVPVSPTPVGGGTYARFRELSDVEVGPD